MHRRINGLELKVTGQYRVYDGFSHVFLQLFKV